MGLLFGAMKESFKNRPQPRPTDKVVLNPPKSAVMGKVMSSMGRQAAVLAAVTAVYSAGEVSLAAFPLGLVLREAGAASAGVKGRQCCVYALDARSMLR